MDTKSSGTTEPNHEFSKKDTAARIEHFKKLGFREEDLVVKEDGTVDIGYVDEYQGIAQLYHAEMEKKKT